MGWKQKRYNRIHWQNRPSTSTALNAENLNHMDAFLNEIDNALISFDAQKLDVETANGMIRTISIDVNAGIITAVQLDGTSFAWDFNTEKIPVSFSLSQGGILTMTTEDGTRFTANISDLIKEYVFDDSETVGFSRRFESSEDNGKGTYHVTAVIKSGSINAEHLDPDYRADIQQFKNDSESSANDSLLYSKDSKRWAVGDEEYDVSLTDNSKYYSEQSRMEYERAKNEAERAGQYADFAIPDFMLINNRLYIKRKGSVDFVVQNNRLYAKLA